MAKTKKIGISFERILIGKWISGKEVFLEFSEYTDHGIKGTLYMKAITLNTFCFNAIAKESEKGVDFIAIKDEYIPELNAEITLVILGKASNDVLSERLEIFINCYNTSTKGKFSSKVYSMSKLDKSFEMLGMTPTPIIEKIVTIPVNLN